MRLSCRHAPGRRTAAVVLAVLMAGPATLRAQSAPQLPQNGQIVHGLASISTPTPSELLITQSSGRAIIDWGSFSIGADGVVRVLQPDAAAALLNRVIGDAPSVIDGMLQANGQIYLLNQRGILVGPTGVIDTAAFLGSILNVSNATFLSGGPMTFSGDSQAAIVNLGVIRASTGDVALIAPAILNTGSIRAPAGTATLVSGRDVLLTTGGDGAIVIKASVPGTAAVDNTGLIEAAEVEIAAAGSPYALAVNNSGIITATALTASGGRIRLDAGDGALVNSGTIESRGAERGGAIDLFARHITLASGTRIDASGETGGGVVRIGGGARGEDPSAPNADTVTIERGATIAANALAEGDGGSVVVWSDSTTRYAGTIEARGADAGAGGQAEVSGGRLYYEGLADLTAPQGATGTLLLDPEDIDIDAAAAAAIATTLDTASVQQQATNSVTVNAAITNATSVNTLTLDAPSIAINANISLPMGGLNVINTTGMGVSVLSALGASIDVGTLTLAGDHPATTLSGPVSTGRLTLDKPGVDAADITIANTGNAIDALDFFGLDNKFTTGDVEIFSATALEVSGVLETGGTVDVRAGGNLTMVPGTAIETPSMVTLAAAGGGSAFINQSAGLITGAGRVVIYSATNVGGYTDGGLGYPVHFGVAPGGDPIAGNVIYIATGSGVPVLAIEADDKTAVYGSPTPALTASFTGGSAADLSAPVQFMVSGAHVNAGTYTIVPFGAASATHQVSFVNGTLTITPAPLVISAADASMTYGSQLPSFMAFFDGFVNGDDESAISGLQFTTAATPGSNVGGYAIVPSGATSSNYTLTYVDGTLTVNPATLVVSVETMRRLYGSANPAFTPLISGLVNGDTADVISGLTFSTDAGVTSPVGSYNVMVSGGAALNYTFEYAPGLLVIEPAPLTITAQPAFYTYGTPVPSTFLHLISGLVAGDTPSSVGFHSTADVAQGSDAGNYPTRLAGSNANYAVTYVPAYITVVPAPLIITANSASRPYGSNNPEFGASISGLYGDDTVPNLSFTTEATLWSPPAAYAIVPASDPMPNYTITYFPGTLTVEDLVLLHTLEVPEELLDPTKSTLDIALPDMTVRVVNTSDLSPSSLFNRAPSIVDRVLAKLDAGSEEEYPEWVDARRDLAREGLRTNDPQRVGMLMPLLMAEAALILGRAESTWTSEERAFVDYIRHVVEAQRRKSAEDAMTAYEAYQFKNQEAARSTTLELIAVDQVPPASFLQQATSGVSVTDEQALRVMQIATVSAGTAAAAAASQAAAAVILKAVSIKAATLTYSLTHTAVTAAVAALPAGSSAAAEAAATAAAQAAATKAAAGTIKGMSAIAGVGVGVAVAAIAVVVSTAITVANAADYDTKMNEAYAKAQQPLTLAELRSMLSTESGAGAVFVSLAANAAASGGE